MDMWKDIVFYVFDAPEQPQLTYEKRLQILRYCTAESDNIKYGMNTPLIGSPANKNS